ncbi:unnamed protein product [Acanthoscelides obtectus]|uniref:Uncharacterized protein n=1 Tax=Acanthoscelides obtectus TaxID=200917 RepID=A0A9P0K4E7_ACAOB|nr:unnamed protein product [Acanthoscelides obtectus]CAK1676700.1 hypothetical protein AOBTE_LOCUS30905 [Acanthoscelides obtectus]
MAASMARCLVSSGALWDAGALGRDIAASLAAFKAALRASLFFGPLGDRKSDSWTQKGEVRRPQSKPPGQGVRALFQAPPGTIRPVRDYAPADRAAPYVGWSRVGPCTNRRPRCAEPGFFRRYHFGATPLQGGVYPAGSSTGYSSSCGNQRVTPYGRLLLWNLDAFATPSSVDVVPLLLNRYSQRVRPDVGVCLFWKVEIVTELRNA